MVDDFQYEAYHREFLAGDFLTIFTDGFSEAMNSKRELFGIERLVELCSDKAVKAGDLGPCILDNVHEFVGDYPAKRRHVPGVLRAGISTSTRSNCGTAQRSLPASLAGSSRFAPRRRAANHFLGHLLLEERPHGPFQPHHAFGRLHAHVAGRHVRAAAQGPVNLIEQVRTAAQQRRLPCPIPCDGTTLRGACFRTE